MPQQHGCGCNACRSFFNDLIIHKTKKYRTSKLFSGLRDGSEERPTLKGRAHTGKTPALGLDACCGLGCNGCYMFWEDDKYAKAREAMKAKKNRSDAR